MSRVKQITSKPADPGRARPLTDEEGRPEVRDWTWPC